MVDKFLLKLQKNGGIITCINKILKLKENTMKRKSVILIMLCILLCSISFTQVFAMVQIQNTSKDTSHIDVIDTGVDYSLPEAGVNISSNVLLAVMILILISTVYSYKKIKDLR